MKLFILLFILTLILISDASARVVKLKDGRMLAGTVSISDTGTTVTTYRKENIELNSDDVDRTYSLSEISNIFIRLSNRRIVQGNVSSEDESSFKLETETGTFWLMKDSIMEISDKPITLPELIETNAEPETNAPPVKPGAVKQQKPAATFRIPSAVSVCQRSSPKRMPAIFTAARLTVAMIMQLKRSPRYTARNPRTTLAAVPE